MYSLLHLPLVLLLGSACTKDDQPEPEAPDASARAKEAGASSLESGVCDSSRHESSELQAVYTFDLDCALSYLADAGCDFGLDPDANGRSISSSVIEDLQNDAENCQSGSKCSGCDDSDSIDNLQDCEGLAGISYFTENAWSDLQVVCPVASETTCEGGSWSSGGSSISLDAEEECAVIEIANWATRGQLTEVSIYSGAVSPSAGLTALQASGIEQSASTVLYVREYASIDEILEQSDVGIDAISDLRDFISSWQSSGRMGDSTLSPEDRLMAFLDSEEVSSEELDFIDYLSSDSISAIVDGRPFESYEAFVAAVGGTAHWNEPGGSLYDYAQEWYAMQTGSEDLEGTGCTIEGLAFSHAEMSCALQLFAAWSCDECRTVLDSRVCEDAINDATSCQVGSSCTGCDDGDGRDNGVDCDEVAAYSYFGEAAAGKLLAHVQENPCSDESCTPACEDKTCGDDGCGGSCGSCGSGETCDTSGLCAAEGCSIEGVFFTADEQECAIWFFENMTCDTCGAVFDSRVCEDAINDASACQSGSSCTGCEDDDDRGDGVSCDEIAAYSYMGASAAQTLLDFVGQDGSCGDPQTVVEGVPLTDEEAGAILEVANGASQTQLDDEAGLDSRAAANIVATRPLSDIEALAAVSYVGATVIEQLKSYSGSWVSPENAPLPADVTTLADEAATSGTSSSYYGQLVDVDRAIITSEPYTYSSGAVSFYVSDPASGDADELKVYISAEAGQDTSSLSIYDDIALTGTFTLYGSSTWEILLDCADSDAVSVNSGGLAYEDYAEVQAAWSSTSSNPEGSVRVVASFGYTYMVPLPIFLDHPMWDGDPPGAPGDSGNEQDHSWNAAAQDALEAWLAD